MYKSRENQHMIDILFVLSLFCVFAVSSVVIILFGAHIYRSTVSQMDDNYTARTSIAYITEKIRQADEKNAIEIRNENGHQILMMTTMIDDTAYATSLYEYDGWLYELFARTDIELPLAHCWSRPYNYHSFISSSSSSVDNPFSSLTEFSPFSILILV